MIAIFISTLMTGKYRMNLLPQNVAMRCHSTYFMLGLNSISNREPNGPFDVELELTVFPVNYSYRLSMVDLPIVISIE